MNIIFDLDDTLYEIVDIFEQAITLTFKEIEIKDINLLYQAFRFHSDELFAFSQESDEHLETMQRLRIIRALEDFNTNINEQEAQNFHDNYEYLQYNSSLNEEVAALLQALIDEGHVLGIITNGDSYRQRQKIKALGLKDYVDDRIIVSGDHAFNKPDVRLFEMMETMCPKDHFMMIGDSYENDIVGALNCGWNALWINKHNQELYNEDIKTIQNILDLSIEDFN